MMEHSNSATEPSTHATEDSRSHGTESIQNRRFLRSAFTPIRRREEDLPTPHETKRVLRRPIFVYGLLSLFFFFVIYLFIRDPGGILFRLTGWESTLRWSGLIVYSSIIALVLFLFILLFRYLSLINMAYLHTTRHTIENGHDHTFLPPVSIVVPAYNEEKLIEGTVASLLAMDYPSFEIIIVDDGSTDNTRAVASKLLGSYRDGAVEVKLVEKSNGGKATALNAGIQVSRYDFLLNVDGDSQLSPNSLRKTIRHFVDPRLGAVAGNVKVLNRDNVWTTLQALEYVEGLNMARSAQSVVKLVNIIPGPLGVFRKQAVFDAGWYSSDTFAEDADITLKIIRAGWRVEYEPEAQAYTEAPASVVDLLKQRYRWTRGIIQAVRKHGDLFFNPVINFGGTIVMWSMAFESLIWPIMNIFANAYFIFVALVFDMNSYLVYWWLSLTILDLIAALYCTAVEKEEIRLVFYSLFYRIFFILIIDVCKTIATIEEYLGFGMNWGKLELKGTGTKSQPSHSEPIPT